MGHSTTSSQELKKDFDNTIKGNVFVIDGQKVLLPSYFEKKDPKLDIVHRYLVLQIYIQQGDNFNLELQIRDKNNVSNITLILLLESEKAYVHRGR